MDEIIEFFIELLLDGSLEISKNKKIPKWIRYPIILLLILFVSLILLFMLYFGLSILRENIIIGSIILLVTVVLIILGIKKIKKAYLERNDKE